MNQKGCLYSTSVDNEKGNREPNDKREKKETLRNMHASKKKNPPMDKQKMKRKTNCILPTLAKKLKSRKKILRTITQKKEAP
jgi:hypothetical protein